MMRHIGLYGLAAHVPALSFGREYDARTRLRIGFRVMVTQWNAKVAADVWQRGWVDSPLRAGQSNGAGERQSRRANTRCGATRAQDTAVE